MQPDSISSSPSAALPAWHGLPPVQWLGRAYTTSEAYDLGLRGLPLLEAAEFIKVPPADLRGLLRAHSDFQHAYDDGWADWEAESLKRTEVALARSAEGGVVKVNKVKVEMGLATKYTEEEYYPPAPQSVAFRLERRDRPRFGKDIREEVPTVGQSTLEAASIYLMERGLKAIQGVPTPGVGQ